MKKLLTFAFIAALAAPLCAAPAAEMEDEFDEEDMVVKDDATARPRKTVAQWPAFFAICEFPETPDILGLRLTIPFSTKQENVTGFDLGLWGRANYFEGFMLNVIRNDVKDNFSGIQVGLYNSIGRGEYAAVQVGLWNEAINLCGVQAGLVNTVGEAVGFQVGLINRAETLEGFQLGLVNVIRDNELRFFPILNVGF